jgi:dihydroxy-acid dehydratase
MVSEAELQRRQGDFKRPAGTHLRGYANLYQNHVLQPDEGCDFDFLQPQTEAAMKFIPPQVGRS